MDTLNCPVCGHRLVKRYRPITNRRQGKIFKQKHPYDYCEECERGWRIQKISTFVQSEFGFMDDLQFPDQEVEKEEEPGEQLALPGT